jgi:antitoxin component of MazEF toxin-antitoxin module
MRIEHQARIHRVGNSLRITIPMHFRRIYELSEGDKVFLEGHADSVTMKFFKEDEQSAAEAPAAA